MIPKVISSVLVPFEKVGGQWVKRDDLPRFTSTKDVIDYLFYHPNISQRRREGDPMPSPVQLEWRDHSEPDLIREYADGVGTLAWLVRNKKDAPMIWGTLILGVMFILFVVLVLIWHDH